MRGIDPGRKRALAIRFDHPRVHIALAADRRGIAELCRDFAYDLSHYTRRFCCALASRLLRERKTREQGSAPRPEILRGVVLAGYLLEISVDVSRIDRIALPVFDILKQLIARQIATAFDNCARAAGR